MAYADDIMAITPGSPEAEELRTQAVAGDTISLRRYVHWTQWQKIAHDRRLGTAEARQLFRRTLEAFPIEVALHG